MVNADDLPSEIPLSIREDFVDEYNSVVVEEESKYSKYALGWNLVRARFQLDYRLMPLLFIGLEAAVGYHYMLSGEDAVAEAKRRALEDTAQEQGLNEEQTNQVGELIGAEKIEANELSGMNYNVGLYLKLDL